MIAGQIEIQLLANVARLQRDMDRGNQIISSATAQMARAANAVKTALGSIASGFGGRELIRMSDEYAKFTAQLKLATQSQREYAAAYADVKRISTQSTQGLGETGVLYARIANGTRELGVAQKQVAAITETVNLSLMVSGATASEAASAQLQLSQAFASGTLRGEEFNAVNEAAPRLMLALADGIGVPVGALKKMAEEGQITSGIMADVLPNALAKLREEAKEVQTISGAFTVLKNNVMEFTGVQAQSSGAVSALTSGIGLLADNLSVVAGAIATVTAAKLSSWAASFVTDTYRQIVVTKELQAATLARAVTTTEAAALAANAKMAEAQADVRATAAAATLAGARVAELRSAVLAADGAVALAIATNGLIPAQARALALEEARALSLAGQAVAQNAATAAANASTAALGAQAAAATVGATAMGGLRAAVGFLGGPIGAIVTLLGVGAMAWSHWGNSAKEANDKTAQSVEETHDEVLSRLQKQIDKLNERAALAKAQPNLKVENAADLERLASLWAEYNDAKNNTGRFAGATAEYRGVMERIALREHGELLQKLTAMQAAQTAAAQKGVDTRVAAFMKENATKKEQMAAELKAIEDLKGKTAEYGEMERRIREKYADKGAAAAIKQEATAYQNLMTSIREKIGANQLELQGYDKLSESQKAVIKLDAEISTGKNKLSADSIKLARAEIDRLEVQEQALEFQKLRAKASEAEAKADADHYTSLRAGTSAIEDRVKQMEREVETYGLTASAAVDAEKAKLEAKLALGPATHAELFALDQQIEKLGQLADLVRKKETLDASKKAADQIAEDQKRIWGDIERTAHDTFISIFDSGKSAFDRLKDTLKNGLYELLYQMTVKKWIINLGTTTTGAATGGTGQNALGGLSSLTSLFSGSGVGKGAAGGASGMLGGAASYGGWIAAGMALADGLYKSGFNDTSTIQKKDYLHPLVGESLLFNKIFQAFGLNNKTANLLSGASIATALFGRKAPEVESQGIQGIFGGAGFSGEAYANVLEKGGLFRSDKRYVKTGALSADQDASFDATYKAMVDAAKGFASTLGIEAGVIDGYNKQIKLQLGADEAKNQEAIAKLFGEIGDELSLRLVPNLASFAQAGEATSATLQRLVTGYATVDEALTAIGMQFGAVGVQSLEARERLLAAAGGLEAFAANTAGFQQNFLTEAERNAPVLKAVTEQLAALGLAGVDTRDEFKQVVLGLDLTTEAGAKQYGQLMAMQAAFAQVYPVLEKTVDATEEAAAKLAEVNKPYLEQVRELERSLMSATDRRLAEIAGMDASTVALYDHVAALRLEIETRDKAASRALEVAAEAKSLQDRLDAMTMSTQQLRDKEIAQLDASNQAILRNIFAIEDSKAALDAEAEARTNAIQAAKNHAAELLSGVDSAFSVLQNVVGREKALLQETANAHRALSSALRSTLDGMRAVGMEQADRLGAQAQIRAALAIARAGGALPDADSLKGALSAVSKDASSMFATQQDYLRDFYATQNDIADLAGLTDKSLSAEEQQLQKLDGILASAQQQIDALKGIDTSIFSLAEALSGFDRAIGAVKADPLASAGGELSKLYKELLGRQVDSTGLAFYTERMSEGVTLAQIREAIKQSKEYEQYHSKLGSKIPGYATGGDFAGGVRLVGEVGPEIEATGASRIHSTKDLMASLRNPSDNSAALAAEIRSLKEEVAGLKGAVGRAADAAEKTAVNTEQLADQFDNATDGGNAMRADVVNVVKTKEMA